MAREKKMHHTVAILATGDEICHGDIINSNSQEIAQRLSSLGIEVRLHMVAPDTENEIESAIRFLLQSHQAIIITGGLGPTSDDLTRFAFSKVIGRPLVFNEMIWQDICDRLKRFGYDTPPESNRQQALFPESSTIIANPNGTAAGCYAEVNDKWLFMLPGPPNECLPMLDTVVLPTLKSADFQQLSYHQNWLLFGVSEGKIAEELDLLAAPYDCVTGYRLVYPYIEFKLNSNQKKDFDTLVTLVEKTIQPYLIGNGQQIASQLLRTAVCEKSVSFTLIDEATGGALETALITPQTRKLLQFKPGHKTTYTITIQGLKEYWEEKKDTTQTMLTLLITDDKQKSKMELPIPFRGKRVLHYAVELISAKLLELIA